MDIHKFFDEQVISGSKLPKERQRFTYDDLIAFAKTYAAEVNKTCNLHIVSQQRELLLAFAKHIEKAGYDGSCLTYEQELDEFLKANNCG